MPIRILTIALLAFTATGVGAAQLYRWVDQDGVVQFSQLPPPDRSVETLEWRDRPAPATPAEAPPARSESEDALDRLTEVYRRNCETARDNLAIYQQSATILEDGEPRRLSDEERADRIESSRSQIEKYCRERAE